MFKIFVTERAEQDLLDNALYIKNVLHSPSAAVNLIDAFYGAIKKLENTPQALPLIKDDFLRHLGIRSVRVKNFTAFFKIDDMEKKLIVLRFIYSRRNWKELLGNDSIIEEDD